MHIKLYCCTVVGGRLGAKQQERMVREDERMREERELLWVARVRAILQPGRIMA